VLTLFSLPKPFVGDTAERQEIALRSWTALGVEVILVGDEPGIGEAAAAAGVAHIGSIARSPSGTPRLDDAFARVDEVAQHPLRLFVNADIVLLPDLLGAVSAVDGESRFLLVGQTLELAVAGEELADTRALHAKALADGRPRGAVAMDWFCFPAGLFDPMPPFLVGRASFDNWLIWRGRQAGPVIDATADVVAIHLPHDYGHLAGGLNEAYYGAEAQENFALGGGKRRIYTLHDASHRLVGGKLRRNHGALFRSRDTMRRIAYKVRGPA
jgi:hypothetical protein